MFGGAEMTGGNLSDEELRQRVRKTLEALSVAIADACSKHGLMRGQIPFVRPANFLAVLATNGLHLVVDNVPIGGIPSHMYFDKRDVTPAFSLDASVGASVREFGFTQPIGILLHSDTLSDNETIAKTAIVSIAESVSEKLAEDAEVARLSIPEGFQYLRRFAPVFLHDHPNPDTNIFLMMRFREGEQYTAIDKTLRERFQEYGLIVLRADDRDYTGDLWENVCLYMLGCKYGVAVFEEVDERQFNPSVALELGFMMAHHKRCLLLRDQRMPKMPTDIVGKLYKPFDTYDIEQSVADAVDSWVKDIGLVS